MFSQRLGSFSVLNREEALGCQPSLCSPSYSVSTLWTCFSLYSCDFDIPSWLMFLDKKKKSDEDVAIEDRVYSDKTVGKLKSIPTRFVNAWEVS